MALSSQMDEDWGDDGGEGSAPLLAGWVAALGGTGVDCE